MRADSTRDICPAPTPRVAPSRANTMAFDLTNFVPSTRNQFATLLSGFFAVTTLVGRLKRMVIGCLYEQTATDALKIKSLGRRQP